MTEDEINALLEPSKYIGRCPEQVDMFLSKVKPLIDGVEGESADISL